MIVKTIHPWSRVTSPHNQAECYAALAQGSEFEGLAWQYILTTT